MFRYKYFEEVKDYKVFLENEVILLYKFVGNKIELKKVYVELVEYFFSLLRFEESN